MSGDRNRQIVLASRPRGAPTDSDFTLVETDIPTPGPGEMLLRTIYLSLDPYMRLRMNAVSHLPPFEIGKPLAARRQASSSRQTSPTTSRASMSRA